MESGKKTASAVRVTGCCGVSQGAAGYVRVSGPLAGGGLREQRHAGARLSGDMRTHKRRYGSSGTGYTCAPGMDMSCSSLFRNNRDVL